MVCRFRESERERERDWMRMGAMGLALQGAVDRYCTERLGCFRFEILCIDVELGCMTTAQAIENSNESFWHEEVSELLPLQGRTSAMLGSIRHNLC